MFLFVLFVSMVSFVFCFVCLCVLLLLFFLGRSCGLGLICLFVCFFCFLCLFVSVYLFLFLLVCVCLRLFVFVCVCLLACFLFFCLFVFLLVGCFLSCYVCLCGVYSSSTAIGKRWKPAVLVGIHFVVAPVGGQQGGHVYRLKIGVFESNRNCSVSWRF